MKLDLAPCHVPTLSLEDVTKSYGHGEAKVTALKNVTITIQANEFVAITGISGSGKSTLLHILGCLDTVSDGQYMIDGDNAVSMVPDRLAYLRKNAFGYIFQDFSLISDLTAEQNVLLPAAYSSLPYQKNITHAAELLDRLGLANRRKHFPAELSGGQQQRVAICRALMNGGAVLLADEPTASLDAEMAFEVMSILQAAHCHGRTVIVSTHDPAVLAFADRIITLKDGCVTSDIRPEKRTSNTGVVPATDTPSSFERNVLAKNFLGDAVRFCLHQLRKNSLRTFLTMLGIVIGTASFIMMLGLGDAQKKIVLSRISELGSDVMFAVPAQPPTATNISGYRSFEDNDVGSIASLAGLAAIAPETSGNVVYRHSSYDYTVRTVATTPEYFGIKRFSLLAGTMFSADDVADFQPVVVLGHSAAARLFPDPAAAVGQFVVANNVLLQIIGVLQPKGASQGGSDADDVAVVPTGTGQRRLLGDTGYSVINMLAERHVNMATVQANVEAALLATRPLRDFRVHNMASIIKATSDTRDSLTMLLAAIACLSLFVGGIGIMNVMLMATLERTREIGIRIAYGARRKDIRHLFVLEAALLSFVAGSIGCLSAVGMANLFNSFGVAIDTSINYYAIALIFCVFVGLLSGIWPAVLAARQNPVNALAR